MQNVTKNVFSGPAYHLFLIKLGVLLMMNMGNALSRYISDGETILGQMESQHID
jgi:hypothetical protein